MIDNKVTLSESEIRLIMTALFDRIASDDLPTDVEKGMLTIHNKLGNVLYEQDK